HGTLRGTVNQLLHEMDGVGDLNDGVFILAATNHPWDVDSALLRPGRFDRLLLVMPPDAEAREAIVTYHLRDRPTDDIDAARIASRTDGFSGADLAHACESAASYALDDSVRSGTPRPISMADLERAVKALKPSTTAWLADARNVVMFANEGGRYDDLQAYLKQ